MRPVLGVRLRKDADATRVEVMEGRRRETEERRRPGGEQGAGEPGCTFAIQADIAVVVLERRRVGSVGRRVDGTSARNSYVGTGPDMSGETFVALSCE